MNKRVLKTMIYLIMSELLVWYILKFFIPEKFVLVINNERIIKAGHYIDTHLWLRIICIYITAFITYWFYIGACCKKLKLNWYHTSIILFIITISVIIWKILPDFIMLYNILAMLGLPLLFKAKFKITYTVFTVHILSQYLSMNIRGLSSLVLNTNYASMFLMTLECYFWLILLYFYNNYKEDMQ